MPMYYEQEMAYFSEFRTNQGWNFHKKHTSYWFVKMAKEKKSKGHSLHANITHNKCLV